MMTTTINEEQYIALTHSETADEVVRRIQWATQVLHGAKAFILLYEHWHPQSDIKDDTYSVFTAIEDFVSYHWEVRAWYPGTDKVPGTELAQQVIILSMEVFMRNYDAIMGHVQKVDSGVLTQERNERNHALNIAAVESGIRELQELLAKLLGLR